MWSRDRDGRGAGSADRVWAGTTDGQVHRRAVGPAPLGRLSLNPAGFRNVSRFGYCTERAGLLFMFVEVDMRVGDRLPDAQRQCGKQGPSPQWAARPRCGRDAFGIAESRDQVDEPGTGIRPRRVARLGAPAGDAMECGHGLKPGVLLRSSSGYVITYLFDGRKRPMVLASKPPVHDGEWERSRRRTLRGRSIVAARRATATRRFP